MMRISERRDSLIRAAEELQKELFEKRIRMLEKEYRKEENRRAVIQVFEKLASSWTTVHGTSGDGRKAASLGIICLFSSILTRTYEFKLSLMGDEFLLEKAPAGIMWKPPYFFEYFEEDMIFILKELKRKFPRLCSAEEDAVRMKCADYYLAAVYKLCRDMAAEILESNELSKIDKTDDFFLFFGKFQGEGEKIWSISC